MIYGYARVSTGGQRKASLVRQLRSVAAGKVFREMAIGAKADRPQLRGLLAKVGPADVATVTRLDRLAHSIQDLLNTLAANYRKETGFRSLTDATA
jgi:DNA invertase Pin-like site-specific DNA recombinase